MRWMTLVLQTRHVLFACLQTTSNQGRGHSHQCLPQSCSIPMGMLSWWLEHLEEGLFQLESFRWEVLLRWNPLSSTIPCNRQYCMPYVSTGHSLMLLLTQDYIIDLFQIMFWWKQIFQLNTRKHWSAGIIQSMNMMTMLLCKVFKWLMDWYMQCQTQGKVGFQQDTERGTSKRSVVRFASCSVLDC